MSWMENDSPRLSVVIPYYKPRFLHETLNSLCSQTDHDFDLYIFDDASPNDPLDIIEASKGNLRPIYKRFSSNLGGLDLVSQWNRCLDHLPETEWVWFIPDDDVPSLNAVHEVRRSFSLADSIGADVLHVPLSAVVKPETKELRDHSKWVPGSNFVATFLQGVAFRDMTLANTVYRFRRLREIDGFVNFPRGWSSDQITTLAAIGDRNVVLVENASLYFRMSGENISSQTSDGDEKLLAGTQSLQWLLSNIPLEEYVDVSEFLRRSYFRAEYFFINVYPFSFRSFVRLAERRRLCIGGCGYLGAFRAVFLKLLMSYRRVVGN